ncbi:hypothetical protein ACAG25_24820, partial [Mycobacterium sp. pV006]
LTPTPTNDSALYSATIKKTTTTKIIDLPDYLTAVAFRPDRQVVAAATVNDVVQLWDVATGRSIGEPLTGHTDKVAGIAFSPDGTRLATASADTTIRLWDTTTGQ